MSDRVQRIVVGVDLPDSATPALWWAFTEAARRDAELDVVRAWMPPPLEVSSVGLPVPPVDLAPYVGAAKQVLDAAIDRVQPDLRRRVVAVHPIAPQERASKALLDVSIGADLLVVGTRRHGALRGLLGSVSHQCAHHATCPVVVVPPDWPTSRTLTRIVVGVDGSAGSALALRWALDEAARWGSSLVIAHSWFTPYPVEPWGMVVTPKDRGVFESTARDLMSDMVDRAVAEGAVRPTVLDLLPIDDASGPALVEASADADLLVVGSRGRGGFAALLVGSTSLHCLHHAACPVALVPAPR